MPVKPSVAVGSGPSGCITSVGVKVRAVPQLIRCFPRERCLKEPGVGPAEPGEAVNRGELQKLEAQTVVRLNGGEGGEQMLISGFGKVVVEAAAAEVPVEVVRLRRRRRSGQKEKQQQRVNPAGPAPDAAFRGVLCASVYRQCASHLVRFASVKRRSERSFRSSSARIRISEKAFSSCMDSIRMTAGRRAPASSRMSERYMRLKSSPERA